MVLDPVCHVRGCAGMAEWLKRRPRDPIRARLASDMTAVGRHALVGSNPTPGALDPVRLSCFKMGAEWTPIGNPGGGCQAAPFARLSGPHAATTETGR